MKLLFTVDGDGIVQTLMLGVSRCDHYVGQVHDNSRGRSILSHL